MRFKDIIGQDKIKRHLMHAARTRMPAQAYMLGGEKYSGKKMLGLAFAASLLCEDPDPKTGESCGKCHSCKMAASGNHPDIIRVAHEKPNEIRVDEVRTQINDSVGLKPYYGGFKIFIADEAEKMNFAAQNAVLKTLEDPPDYVVMLLLASNISGFLPTVLSRCVKLSLASIPDDIIIKQLQKNTSLPSYEAKVIAAFAQGNLGKAYELAGSEEFKDLKNDIFALLSRANDKSSYMLLNAADELEDKYTERLGDIFDLFVIWYRDVLLYKATGSKERLICREEHYSISRLAGIMEYRDIHERFDAIRRARENLSARVGQKRVMQELFLTLNG